MSEGKGFQLVLVGGLVLGLVWYVLSRFRNYTKDTPYEGAGALGVLGKATDDLAGGKLSQAGSALGQTLYDWTHNDGAIAADVDVLIPVIFPNGTKRTISDRRLTLGRFQLDGQSYRLQRDGTGQAYAVVD